MQDVETVFSVKDNRRSLISLAHNSGEAATVMGTGNEGCWTKYHQLGLKTTAVCSLTALEAASV